MKKLNELMELPKDVEIDLTECHILAQSKVNGVLTTVAEQDGRYYLHTDNGCREIALDWDISEKQKMFRFTHDDLHICQFTIYIESGIVGSPDALKLDKELIQPGMQCSFNGVTAIYNAPDSITFQMADKEKTLKVEHDREYVYKFLKTKVKASGGAKGLYAFLDEIAETVNIGGQPALTIAYEKIKEQYLTPNKDRGMDR